MYNSLRSSINLQTLDQMNIIDQDKTEHINQL